MISICVLMYLPLCTLHPSFIPALVCTLQLPFVLIHTISSHLLQYVHPTAPTDSAAAGNSMAVTIAGLCTHFNTALTGKAADDDDAAMYQDNIGQTILEDDEEDGDGDAVKNEDEDEDTGDTSEDLEDDEIDELQELNEEDQEQILEETAAVRTTVTKVRFAKQIIFVFSPTNYLIVYRSDNYHLPSFTPQPSLSSLGDVSTVSSISSSDSFPAMS